MRGISAGRRVLPYKQAQRGSIPLPRTKDHMPYSDPVEMRAYMLRRYRARTELARFALGGRCVECGSTENLEFDHKDNITKSFEIAHSWNTSALRFWREISKCQLLCDRHHNEKTIREKGQSSAIGTHGTISAVRYCRPICDLCRAARNRCNREYKRRKRIKEFGSLA